jgi:hypothetical protein
VNAGRWSMVSRDMDGLTQLGILSLDRRRAESLCAVHVLVVLFLLNGLSAEDADIEIMSPFQFGAGQRTSSQPESHYKLEG